MLPAKGREITPDTETLQSQITFDPTNNGGVNNTLLQFSITTDITIALAKLALKALATLFSTSFLTTQHYNGHYNRGLGGRKHNMAVLQCNITKQHYNRCKK
jgi:hypothetical protein